MPEPNLTLVPKPAAVLEALDPPVRLTLPPEMWRRWVIAVDVLVAYYEYAEGAHDHPAMCAFAQDSVVRTAERTKPDAHGACVLERSDWQRLLLVLRAVEEAHADLDFDAWAGDDTSLAGFVALREALEAAERAMRAGE